MQDLTPAVSLVLVADTNSQPEDVVFEAREESVLSESFSWRDATSFVVVTGDALPNEVLAKQLSAFSRKRGVEDPLPYGLASSAGLYDLAEGEADHHVPETSKPGALLEDESRLMVEASTHEKLYGIPTTNGWICTVVPDVGAEVFRDLHQGITLSAHRRGVGGPLLVYGIVENGVTRLEILVGKEWFGASVGENAFLVRIQGPDADATEVRAVRLVRRDGTSRTVSIQ